MITQEYMIKPLSLGRTAIQEAVECYREWMPQVSFEEDVAHYLSEGMVLSTTTCFALARLIEGPRTKKPAWFIRMAVGRVDELLAALARSAPFALEEICLCRGKKGDLRIRSYSLERMLQHSTLNTQLSTKD
jgi:hypothetical protein